MSEEPKNTEGLICSSACLQGEINWHLNLSDRNVKNGALGYEEAKKVALRYKEVFGDDFYLELMRHGIGDQHRIDKQIIQISQETGIKIIAVKSPEQMAELFADIPEALENTQEIANKCNLEIKLGDPTPPNFKFSRERASESGIVVPEPDVEYSLENDIVLFVEESKKGLEERLKIVPEEKHEEYRERLKVEMDIINSMKFPGYMLIVWDFVDAAKQMGIPVGPGRGLQISTLCHMDFFLSVS